MSGGWIRTRLGAAFTTMTGSTPPKADGALFGTFMPLVKPPELRGGLVDSADDGLTESGARFARTLPAASVLVSCIGNLGKVGLNTVPVAFNQQINAVLPDRAAAIPEFMFYQALSPAFKAQLESLATGTTVRIVNKSKFNEIEIVLAPLPEQRRIVAILDEAFEGIASAKVNAERNLQNARELFASRMHVLFGQEEAWERVPLAELMARGWITSHLDGNHGSDYPRKEEFVDAGVPYIAASAINGGAVDFGEAKYLSPERASSIRKGLAKDRDVLFAHNATVGPVAILSTAEDFVILGTSLTYYRCDPQHIHPEYLAHFMVSPAFTSQYAQVMKQSTRNQVPITKQRELFHVIPPIDVQKRIADGLDDLSTQTERLADLEVRKLAAFDELKNSLLRQAFAGHL